MKKHFSRLLSLVVTVTMLASSLPMSALAGSYIGGTSKPLTEIETFTVTFVDPFGETTSCSVDQGSTLNPEKWPVPTHEGYRLRGWYRDGNRVEALEDIRSNLTLTAEYIKQYTIIYEDWDGKRLQSVVVDEGTAFDASSYNGDTPKREGYEFTHWTPASVTPVTGDTVIRADYRELTTYTVTIQYLFEDGTTAADPYMALVCEGYKLEKPITSPEIRGFVCQTPVVSIPEAIYADRAPEKVYYLPSSNTTYTVEYCQQDTEGSGYTVVASETITGTTGAMTTVSEADANAHLAQGFRLITDMNACNEHIAADDSTVIRVYYDREIHYVIFDTADGDYIEPISGRYGATVTMPSGIPHRVGYDFVKWDRDVTSMTAEDVTVTAEWRAKTVDYTVVVWRENADNDDYSVLGTLTFSGKTGDKAAYTPDKFTDKNNQNNIERSLTNGSKFETRDYFDYSAAVTAEKNGGVVPAIKGDGSTIYNVYYKRIRFTINFFINKDQVGGKPVTLYLQDGTIAKQDYTDFGNPIYTLTRKYDESFNGKYPYDISYENQTQDYNGWDKINNGANSTAVTTARIRMDPNLCNTQTTGAYAYRQDLRLQLTGRTYYVDRYYLVESLDGLSYKEAGYYEHRSTTNPTQPMSGAAQSNKPIAGFTYSARATFTITEGGENYSIYSDAANKTVYVGEAGLNTSTVNGIIRNAQWAALRVNDKNFSQKIQKYNVNIWWYTRNPYDLIFKNGSITQKESGVLYEQPLLSYRDKYAHPERPVGIGEDYEFIGWYEDEGFTKPVNWETITMPASSLVLYACWRKPSYTVSFDFADGQSELLTVYVGKGDKMEPLTTPVRGGYSFEYWTYKDASGVDKPFSFGMEINHDYTLTAQWRATSVTYKVRYVSIHGTGGSVYDAEGRVLAEQQFSGKVGETVTLYAPAGFESAKHDRSLFPTTLSTSIELLPDSESNLIVFEYDHADTVYYKVRYVDENGVDIATATDAIATEYAVVTENAVNVGSYTPERYQYSMVLALETSPSAVKKNVIVFRYRQNPSGEYSVKHYLQNLDNNMYTEDKDAAETLKNVSLGSVAHAEVKDYPGFGCVEAISKLSGTVYSSAGGSGLTLYVYYNRLYVPYTARFVDKDTGEQLGEYTASARFGKTATVYAHDFISYTLVGDNSADILVTANPEQNVHVFEYQQRDDLSYVVRFLDESNTPIAASIGHSTDETGRPVKLGETYSYTLTNSTLVSNQISYHLADNGGETPFTQSVTITEDAGNYIDFHYEQDTYGLNYNANGGDNAPVDTQRYHADDRVTLADAGQMTYGTNRFEGWTTDENVLGKVYITEAELAAVTRATYHTFAKPAGDATLYAVWSHLTATLTYAADTAYQGTLPRPVRADLNADITVDTGAGLSRVGYTFDGWKLKDGAGAFVTPGYGAGEGMRSTIAINTNTTLYATWKPLSYAVFYQMIGTAGEGWVNPNSAIASYTIETSNVSLSDATMNGYRFLGWYTDAEGTVAAGSPAIRRGSTGDKVFYAKFEPALPQRLTVSGYSDVYDGQAHGVVLSDPAGELLQSDIISYSTANSYTDVTGGAQSVTVTVSRGGVTVYTGSATVNIRKRPIEVQMASALTLRYNGSAQELPAPKYTATAYDAAAKVGPLPEHQLNVTPIGDQQTDAGTYPVGATVTVTSESGYETDNYDIRLTEGSIVIAQATSSASSTAAAHVYDAQAVGFDTPRLLNGQGEEITDRTLEWKWADEEAWHSGDLPTETEVRSLTNARADAYVLDVRLSHRNYETKTVQATLTITPAPVMLTAERITNFPYTLTAEGTAKEWAVTNASYQVTAEDASLPVNTLYAGDVLRYELANNTQSAIGGHAVTFAGYTFDAPEHAKNYAVSTTNGEIAVVRGTDAATLTVSGFTETYSAAAYTLAAPSVTVAAEDGTPIDRTSEFRYAYTVNGVATQENVLPAFTEAGTYTVTVTASSAQYAQPQTAEVTVTILPATLRLTSGSASAEYDAAAHTVDVLSETTGLVTDTHRIQAAPMMTSQTNSALHVGRYPVQIDSENVVVLDAANRDVTANYDVQTVAGMLEITAAPLTVRTVSASIAYDGQPHTLAVTADGLKGDDALTGYTLTPENATAAGTYTLTPSEAVIGSAETTSDYIIHYQSGTMAILDFTIEGIDTVYNGLEHRLTVDVPQEIADLYNVSYSGNAEEPVYRDVADENVAVTLTPKTNEGGLPVLTHTVRVRIAPKPITLQVNRINKTYDGGESQLVVTLPQGAAATNADEQAIMDNLTYTDLATDAPLASAVFTNVCDLRVEVASTNANYEITPAQTAVAITKRPITVRVTPENRQFVYDEQTHTLQVVSDYAAAGNNSGLLAGHVLEHTGANLSVTDVTADWLDATVGTVTLYADADKTIDVTGNYDVRTQDTKVRVNQPDMLTLELAAYEDVYDGAAHEAIVAAVKDGQREIDLNRFRWTYNGEAAFNATNVGTTQVSVLGTCIDGNYPDVAGTTHITISQRPITLSVIDSLGNPYAPGISYTVTYDYTAESGKTGLLAGQTIRETLTGATQTEAGTYAVAFNEQATDILSGDESVKQNYQITYRAGTLQILPAQASATATSESYTYDGTARAFTIPVLKTAANETLTDVTVQWREAGQSEWQSGELPQHTRAQSTLRAGGREDTPGDYVATPYTVELLLTSPNYTPVETSAAMTIQRRAVRIAATSQSFPYDTQPHMLAVTESGAAQGDTLTYDFAQDAENSWTNVTDGNGHVVRINRDSVTLTNTTGESVNDCYAIGTTSGAIYITSQRAQTAPVEDTVTYHGGAQSFPMPVLLDAQGNAVTEPVTYWYRSSGENDWTITPYTQTDVGDYTLSVRLVSANYATVETTSRLVIERLPVSLHAPSNSFMYTLNADGTEKVWTLSAADVALDDGSNPLASGHGLADVTLSTNASLSAIGSNTVTIETVRIMNGDDDVTNNYAITRTPGAITVTPSTAAAAITATGLRQTYQSADYTLTQPTVSVLSDDGATMIDRTADYRLVYTVTSDALDAPQTFRNGLPHYTDAGTYHVSIHAESNRFATPDDVSVDMVILPRDITITAGSVDEQSAFTYNGREHELAAGIVTAGALQGEDAIPANGYTFVNGQSNRQTDAVDRAVTLQSVVIRRGVQNVTDNYNITLAAGRMIVKPLTVIGGLTLTGDDHVYDGGEHYATLSDRLSTALGALSLDRAVNPDGTPRFTVTYTATPEGGTEGAGVAESPRFTDATTQTITAYVADASGNLVITPATAQVRITPRTVNVAVTSETNIPYDGLSHTLGAYTADYAVMTNGVANGSTGLVGEDTASATLVNAGPYTIPDTYPVSVADGRITTGNANNYTFAYHAGEMQIVPATGIALTLNALDSMYDGAEHGYAVQALVPEGTPYSLSIIGENGETAVTEETMPTYVAANRYPLTLRIRSPYYTDSADASATLNISKRPITVDSGDNHEQPFYYTGEEQSVTAAKIAGTSLYPLATNESFDPASAVFEADLGNSNADVCDRDVKLNSVHIIGASGDTTANYEITYAAGRIVINQSAASTTEPTTVNADYDGTRHGFTNPALTDGTNVIDGATYEYSEDGQNYGRAMPTYSDVKRNAISNAVIPYTIYVRISHPNYETRITTASLTIRPAPLTVVADTRGYPYAIDGEGNPVTFSINSASVESGTLYENAQPAYTFRDNTRSALGWQNVYIDTVRIMAGQDDKTHNYDITTRSGILTITRGTAASTLYAMDASEIYDGQKHGIAAPTVSVLGAGGENIDQTNAFTFTYDVLREGDAQATTVRQLADVERVDAGSYSVTIHAASEQYAEPDPVTVSLTIAPRTVTITSEDNSAAPLTFNGREQQVKGDAKVENLVENHRLSELAYEDGQSNQETLATDRSVLLSSVKVTTNGRDVTSNYRFNFQPGRIVILPLTITAADINLRDATVVYDGLPHSLTLPQTLRTNAGTVNVTDEFDVQYLHQRAANTENPAFYDTGTYPVTVRLTSRSGNYEVEDATANVDITPRPLTISYGRLAQTYDAQPHETERTIQGLTERDAIVLNETGRTATDATRLDDGSFGAITTTADRVAITDATDATIDRASNYDVTVRNGTLEVRPIELTVAAGTASYVYNAAEQTMADFTVRGKPVDGQTVNARLTGNTATRVVDRQGVGVADVTVTDATGVNRTRNYNIKTVNGALSITPAPLTLGITSITTAFDGAAHQPDAYVVSGLQGSDRLAAYALANMPQMAAGNYIASYDRAATVLRNARGEDVTANYRITYTTGVLSIAEPTTAYTVEYYYDGVLDSSVPMMGLRNSIVTVYPAMPRAGYTFDHAAGAPLTLTANAETNVIRVYYVAVQMPELTEVTDADIPLSGNMASLNVGMAVE